MQSAGARASSVQLIRRLCAREPDAELWNIFIKMQRQKCKPDLHPHIMVGFFC